MDGASPDLLEQLAAIWGQTVTVAQSMVRPSRLWQLAGIVALVLAAWLIGRIASRRLRIWLRTRSGWPMWRMRMALTVDRRMTLLVFVILSWLTVLIMREVTWPSRSYLIAIAATLASAWLGVALLARLIRNPLARRLATWGAWIYATVALLGLTEETAQILDTTGIQFGDFRLSLLTGLKALIVIVLLFVAARFLTGAAKRQIEANEDFSPSMRVLTVKVLQALLYSAAFFIGLKSVGVDLTGLAVLSGAIGVGLGFGLQKVVSNLVSGVIILLDKSIKPGDVISLGETFGWINALGARYVSVVTRDGKEYLIPNEDLITGQVVNWSHSNDFVRLDIYFGTAYSDDPHKVRAIAIEAAMTVDRVLAQPKKPVCHIVGFGDSSVDYILRFWITDPTEGLTNVRGQVYLALWDAFKENGVSIPFPQREVKVLEGSVLQTDRAPEAAR